MVGNNVFLLRLHQILGPNDPFQAVVLILKICPFYIIPCSMEKNMQTIFFLFEKYKEALSQDGWDNSLIPSVTHTFLIIFLPS